MQTHNYEDLSGEELLGLIGKAVLIETTTTEGPTEKYAIAGILNVISETPTEVTITMAGGTSQPAYIQADLTRNDVTLTFA